jgi:hypothetical protein
VTGIPHHDPATMETNVPGVFIAGVLSAGFNANKVFIENGRGHGDRLIAAGPPGGSSSRPDGSLTLCWRDWLVDPPRGPRPLG